MTDTIFSNNWFELNNVKNSFNSLKQLVDVNKQLTIIEVGCFEGRSTCYFLDNYLKHNKSLMYCIDTFEGSEEHSKNEKKNIYDKFVNNIQTRKNHENVIIKKGFSFDKLCELKLNNIKADIIYIDGSHNASDVLSDLVLAWNCCKINGFIICDDYLWVVDNNVIFKNPKIAIDNFINVYFDKLQIINGWTNYQVCFKKLKE